MSELTSDKNYISILKLIDERLLPETEAKTQRGEVFTSPLLVKEMIFGLKKSGVDNYTIWGLDENGNFIDEHENDRIGGISNKIWRNPESTFLDPANGIGNFSIIAFFMIFSEFETSLLVDIRKISPIIHV